MSHVEYHKRNAIQEGTPIITLSPRSDPIQMKPISDNESRTSKGSKRSKTSQKDAPYFKCPVHVKNKNIYLEEDCFGTFYDENGSPRKVKRFTWKNHNDIEAQIITYGARVTSIKFPNRKGVVEDVVLGFPDLAGYLYYNNSFMGATIGRVTNKVENSTFVIDGRQFWINANDGPHQTNGGVKGFDKIVWNSHVSGTKVILSHTSPHLDEGYPGDLMVKIEFQLTTKNEFRIDMEAISTKRTIVNLSNLVYFNLGGHHSGPEELYKHTVTINANSYTVNLSDGFPSGEIKKVIGSKYDLMVPKILKNIMGVKPHIGFDQNFCVNREDDCVDDCFVARAVHTRSGRILEVYSNQYGVNFSTANDFGGELSIPAKSSSDVLKISFGSSEDIFSLLNLIHNKMLESTDLYDEQNFLDVLDLVQRIHKCKFEDDAIRGSNAFGSGAEGVDQNFSASFEPMKLIHLRSIHSAASVITKNTTASELGSVVKQILEACISMDVYPGGGSLANVIQKLDTRESVKKDDSIPNDATEEDQTLAIHNPEDNMQPNASQHLEDATQDDITQNPEDVVEKDEQQAVAVSEQEGETISDGNKSMEEKKFKEKIISKKILKPQNIIPSFYKDGQLHGKNGALYKRHGAMAFQTQNYPNAIHHENFPNCTLRPGETYRHTIVYKFWVQSGNPSAWIRRNR